jgi:hypothetical protein
MQVVAGNLGQQNAQPERHKRMFTKVPLGWNKHNDDQGKRYYSNNSTQESSWVPPEGSTGGSASPRDESLSAYSNPMKRTEAKKTAAPKKEHHARKSTKLPPDWNEHYDDEGQRYYTNEKTNESSWSPPENATGGNAATKRRPSSSGGVNASNFSVMVSLAIFSMLTLGVEGVALDIAPTGGSVGGLACWAWVVPWLVLVLGGMEGVQGVPIPDHVYDKYAWPRPRGIGIRQAVDTYTSSATIAKYGLIEAWDTSLVTDMSMALYEKTGFNADISAWDVGKVTKMANSTYTLFHPFL